MKPAANRGHEGKTRTRVGPASLLFLLLAALAPALAEASLPRAGASLLEHEDVAASRHDSSRQAAPFRSPAIAPAVPAIGSGFTLFAGDELARASRAPGTPAFAADHAGDLAPASRERDERFALRQGADVFGLEPLRGPPPLSEDLCQGDDECLAGTRIGGLELEGAFFTEGRPRLSLELQWACGVSSCGLADGKPLDPWGLAIWTSGQIADKYYEESKQFGLLTAIRNEALRRALNAEQDAQGAPRPSLWERGLSAIGSLFGQANAADQRVEDVVGDTARDLTRNVVPPSTAPVDRTHRIPTEYGGGSTQSDRIANAANGLSETAGDVAEGGARGGYQAGRDWFFAAGLGKALEEARALRAAERRHGHHAYMKALGGHPKQRLVDILAGEHFGAGGVHSDLARFEGGWLFPKKGMTGSMIVDRYGVETVEDGLRRFYSQEKWQHLRPTFEEAVEFTRRGGTP